jgi:hypothetical protein
MAQSFNLTKESSAMLYPDSTPTCFSSAKSFVENHGDAVWCELCDTVRVDAPFSVRETAKVLRSLKGYKRPDRYLRAVLKAAIADFLERPREYEGRCPVRFSGKNMVRARV